MSKGITRSTFRNITLLMTIGLLLAAVLVFRWASQAGQNIENRMFELANLQQELQNAARLSAALSDLDQLTIDEQTATRLNILRHLGLEQSTYNFSISSKQIRAVGDASLFLRDVVLTATLPYAGALALADRLHNTKKIVINSLQVRPSSLAGDNVELVLSGTIYGLEKQKEELVQ